MKLQLLSAIASLALAQEVLEAQSFGHKGRISENGQHIPHWKVLGDHHGQPEILSDHIIMTPPWPAYRQSALWAEQPMAYPHWTTDLEFRVSGPDNGKSELTLWYTKGNQAHIGTKSLYTIEQFEGLAILIDREGSAGQIRAFLNDGRTNFASHPHVEALAFGHCDYPYHNLGKLSKMTVQQDADGFQITIDGNTCFRSNSVVLPAHNFFGITAESNETPDSIEVFKLVTHNAPKEAAVEHHQNDADWEADYGPDHMDDSLASSIRDQQAQFTDLHNRVQAISHSVDNLFKEITRLGSRLGTRLEDMSGQIVKAQQISQLEGRIGELENKIQQLRNDQKDWSGHFNQIENSLKSRHDALLASFPESMGNAIASKGPNMKLFLILVFGFQVLLGGAYLIYKRRLAQAPKKYL